MSRTTSAHTSSTLHDPAPSPPAESKYPPDTLNPIESYATPKRTFRRYVTPFEAILNHRYSGHGTDSDPYIIDWLPHDLEDPQRWNTVYKWSNIAVVSFATLAVALSSSAYTGGIESLIRDFGASEELLIAGVSLFVVGFAFGPLMWAPMSEVFGRRIVFIISLGLMTLWQAVTCAAQNVGTVIVFRFLAGFFGSSPLANAGGSIADVLDANQRGLGMALFAAAPFLGPSLGPITGGFIGLTSGWRWVMAFLAMFTGVLTIILILFSAETYAPYLLRQRAIKLSKATGKVYRYRGDATKPLVVSQLFKTALVRPWKFLIYEPIVIILTIYTALVYGILYLNFAAYPIVFQQGKGWNTGVGGLAFLGILVGTVISVLLSIFYINPNYMKIVKKKGGRADPEDRLPPAIWGGVLIVIGIAGFAATDGENVHWIAPIIFGIPFGTGVIVMFLAVLNYLVESYLLFAASVLAANSVLRSLFGAAFPLFTGYMYDALGVHWAAALPGFIALACVPFIVIFYKYGAKIRAKCKYSADASRQFEALMAARAAQNKQDEEANPSGATGEKAADKPGEGPGGETKPPLEAGGGEEEKAMATEDAATFPTHPSHPSHPDHHEWTIYEVLADRDEIDLEDDERIRLEDLHRKFDGAKRKPGGGTGGVEDTRPRSPSAAMLSLGKPVA